MTQQGRRLGRYRLEELLGQGGMAEVWRAADERLGRTVAIKVILSAHLKDGQFRERFHREARLVASLDHPNILPVYDYGDEEGVPYLVMPYLDGGTLRDRMVGSPIPFAQAVSWIHQLGDALDAAHAAGILHRDVKPANVLIRRDDRLALADFGIAKMFESSTGLTRTGMVVGTPIYMAPEQAQGKPATTASDRYALAVLAYELLSGKPPFEGESALSLMHQHVSAQAPLLSTSVYGLPAGLDSVFEQALAKEPERRPSTCRAFARQLFAFVPTGTGLDLERATAPWARADQTAPTVFEATPKRIAERAAASRSELTSQPTISTSPQPTRRALFALAGAAAGAVLLVGAWFLVPRSRPDPGPVTQSAAPAPAVVPSVLPATQPAGKVKVVELPLATATAESAEPGPGERPRPAPNPPPAALSLQEEPRPGPGGVPPAGETGGPGGDANLQTTQSRLDPVLRGGTRPTRADFEATVRAAQQVLEGEPMRPDVRGLESYGLGGLAYLDGRTDEARFKLVAALGAGKRGASDLPIPAGLVPRERGSGPGMESWELALAYGDARREAGPLLDASLARNPADAKALLGRAGLRRMERRSADAIADATKVYVSNSQDSIGSAAASLIGDECASQRDWEKAVQWYRKAVSSGGPSAAHAGWECGRLLEEQLGRGDEAREVYGIACDSGNQRACVKVGKTPPRKRFPKGPFRP